MDLNTSPTPEFSTGSSEPVSGIVFDKDGTLISFRGTWDLWAFNLIEEATGGDPVAAERLANAMQYDLAAQCFQAGSPIIAGTASEAATLVAYGLGRHDVAEVEAWISARAATATMAPVVPLAPFLAQLKMGGLALGVATNDGEAVARANLESLGVADHFDYVAGFDSGYGGKPDPGMVRGFCTELGLRPETCVMVGDSPHDLLAAARAGVRPVAVLTGISEAEDLAPLAEVVLPDIGHLPAWLGLQDAI